MAPFTAKAVQLSWPTAASCALPTTAGACPQGKAVATTAGNLPAHWVIHTVGPVYSATEDRSALLASCYRESLRVAGELGATVVAFPAISTGIYRWPLESAAKIAINVCRTADTTVTEARFVLFSPDAYAAFETALADDGSP